MMDVKIRIRPAFYLLYVGAVLLLGGTAENWKAIVMWSLMPMIAAFGFLFLAGIAGALVRGSRSSVPVVVAAVAMSAWLVCIVVAIVAPAWIVWRG